MSQVIQSDVRHPRGDLPSLESESATVANGRTWANSLFADRPPNSWLAGVSLYPWLVVGCVCVAGFLIQVDASIVSLMLPTLEDALGVPVASAEWVSIAYLLTLAVLVIPFGRLSDLTGRKVLYMWGFVIFITGSALCSLAPALGWLIGFRVLQAVGAAMLQANSPALVTAVIPRTVLGRALATQGTAQTLGLLVGPALGGLLVDTLSWRWAFFIAVPLGLAGALASCLVLPATRGSAAPGRSRRAESFDWVGAGFLVATLGLSFLGLSFGNSWGWTSLKLSFIAVATLAAFVGFLLRESWHASPLVDLSLFRIRRLRLGIPSAVCAYGALFGTLFLVPFYMERILGENPAGAGLVVAAVALPGVLGPIAGWLADKKGPRLPTVAGMGIAAVALSGLALIQSPSAQLAALLLVGHLARVPV